jgi:hypothetical protein
MYPPGFAVYITLGAMNTIRSWHMVTNSRLLSVPPPQQLESLALAYLVISCIIFTLLLKKTLISGIAATFYNARSTTPKKI